VALSAKPPETGERLQDGVQFGYEKVRLSERCGNPTIQFHVLPVTERITGRLPMDSFPTFMDDPQINMLSAGYPARRTVITIPDCSHLPSSHPFKLHHSMCKLLSI
jgi:hypothetical protein